MTKALLGGVMFSLVLGACGASRPDTLAVAVGSVTEVGYYGGPCTLAPSAAAAARSGYKGRSDAAIAIDATAPGTTSIDCADDKFDTRLEVREAASIEVIVRDPVRSVRVGADLPEVCVIGRDAQGRELSLGTFGDLDLTFSDHVTRKPEAADHGMGAAVFGTGTFGCASKLVAAKAGTATFAATWNGKTASRSLEVRP